MSSKTGYVKIAIIGLKVLAAVVGGVALYAGLNKLSENKQSQKCNNKPEDNNSCEPPKFESGQSDTGKKIMDACRVGQVALNSTMNIISGIGTVANSINRMFDKSYYDTMLNDPYASSGYFGPQMIPSYAPGNYPWNKREDPGLPYNRPIYQGKDNTGEDIYWIRRPNNIIECW